MTDHFQNFKMKLKVRLRVRFMVKSKIRLRAKLKVWGFKVESLGSHG